jgi:T5orf172 domain
MTTNYIYLLQEREFIKTKENVYKIGRTKQENHKRFQQYPKSSILLFQMICDDCNNIEKRVIEQFKEKFNQRKDIGYEYFEGDYKVMINMIYLIISKEICDDKIEKDDDENHNKKNKILCEKISKIFPDYKNDQSFGGLKKYVKITLINKPVTEFSKDLKTSSTAPETQYVIDLIENHENNFHISSGDLFIGFKKFLEENYSMEKYNTSSIGLGIKLKNLKIDGHSRVRSNGGTTNIFDKNLCKEWLLEKGFATNNKYIINYINSDGGIILCDSVAENVSGNLQYFHTLISKKIILPDKIYDINSNDFINKIIKTKFNLGIKNYDEFRACICCVSDETKDESVSSDETKDESVSSAENEDEDNPENSITKKIRLLFYHDIIINNELYSKFFGYDVYLRKNIPYLIRWNIDNDYYVLNRDYVYIGLNTKYIKYENKGQTYLFNDGSKPWNGKDDFIKMCNKYAEIIKKNSLKKCLNSNNLTENILSQISK